MHFPSYLKFHVFGKLEKFYEDQGLIINKSKWKSENWMQAVEENMKEMALDKCRRE